LDGFRLAPSREYCSTVSALRQRVGLHIKRLRLSHGLTQEQLGERASLSYKFIGEVERGIGNPTVDSLDAIARGLGVQMGEFFVTERPAVSNAVLGVEDVALLRDARDSLEDVLKRLGVPPEKRRRNTRRTTPRGR
jgi:transcriptional regulator with XRE-family HTH domain